MKRYPKLADSIFIGDQVVDVCAALGIYCRAMSTGSTPMIETRYPFARHLECVLCIQGPKRKMLYHVAKKLDVNHIVLEKNGEDREPASMADELAELGYKVDVMDFTGPLGRAILQAGEIFERQDQAKKLADEYDAAMETARQTLPSGLDRRVLVLMGLSYPGNDAAHLLAEQPDGDADNLVLRPAGCRSVGEALANGGPSGLGFTVIHDLEKLAEARPDVIITTGDAFVAQQAIQKALKNDPALSSIPAIRDQAIFHLPHCCRGTPMDFPDVLRRWATALS